MSIEILSSIAEARTFTDAHRRAGQRIGVVPTMGALHEGHLALVRRARALADVVVVTVFVNPTQFGPGEDFDAYPRDLGRDVALSDSAGAAAVFAPKASEMYPSGETTRVTVSGLTQGYCGGSRPGHFDGVTTIVSKLWAVLGPCVAVFGQKDYQQLKVIERMTRDLLFPVQIDGHPIVREADGLALSSRNTYLSASDRSQALSIPRALSAAHGAFESGERSTRVLRETVRGALDRAGLRIDYVELGHPDSLERFDDDATLPNEVFLAVAAFSGRTRLIDNVVLGRDAAPGGGVVSLGAGT